MTTLVQVAEPLAPGQEVLPGYEVVGLMCRGGRVDTYDAVSLDRDCRCVVKVVRPDRRHEEHVAAALLTEGRLLTGLSHPHLVRGYEVVETPTPAVVLETLPGATLGSLLDDGPLEVAEVVLLGLQLVSVLGYLHRRGWLHLDVKPDNVVVTDGGRAVLLDLGLAAPPGRVPRGTGTPGYAAPEQERDGLVSAAADTWGLAATLFAAATDEEPGGSPDVASVPVPLRALLAAGLRPSPADRVSLAQLRERLSALVERTL